MMEENKKEVGNMKKPFWMKLITCILAVMLLILGILPTNVTYADEQKMQTFECEEDGWYFLMLYSNFSDKETLKKY